MAGGSHWTIIRRYMGINPMPVQRARYSTRDGGLQTYKKERREVEYNRRQLEN